MTYIRMTGGRDRGHVKDFPVPAAKEMLALGQALPVDFDEPDALGFRELETPVNELQLRETATAAPSVPTPPSVHPNHREGKKKR